MKKINYAMRKISLKALLPLFFLLVSAAVNAQDADAGKKLFKANCASCHNMDKKMTGPALIGVGERVPQPAEVWLKAWIQNNGKLRASGDAYANKIFKDFNGSPMSNFEWMSDKELDDVIAYITTYSGPDAAPAGGASELLGPYVETAKADDSNLYTWLGVIAIALIVIVAFTGVNRSLANSKRIAEGGEAQEPMSFWEAIGDFAVNQKIKFGLIVISIVGALATIGWNFHMSIGVFGGNGFEKTEDIENYHPSQPIEFRHDIHVTQNEIDCKYCHSGTLESKHALIPSANVCMNCHKAVSEGHLEGSADRIGVIYEHTGWDTEKGAYLHADGKYYDTPREDRPIEWNKVHNLQDFVYFNHSQHVVVGGVECETCHGNVGSKATAEHFAPLTMGWCINCHRETSISEELKFSGKPNGYYEKMHNEFKEAYKHDAEFDFTVEKIGGLECAKCHY